MQRSAFEVESSDSNFQVRGREELSRSAEREKHSERRARGRGRVVDCSREGFEGRLEGRG